MNETELRPDLMQYLDICQRSLKKYIALGDEQFEVDHAVLMLECNVICKQNIGNALYGDMICFLCASICIDCLDPLVSTTSEQIMDKYDRIYRFLRASIEGEHYGNGPIEH